MCLQLRSGRQYGNIPIISTPFKTNLRFGDLLSKALKREKELADFNEKLAALADANPMHVEVDGAEGTANGSTCSAGARDSACGPSEHRPNDGEWSPHTLSPLTTPPSSPEVTPCDNDRLPEIPPSHDGSSCDSSDEDDGPDEDNLSDMPELVDDEPDDPTPPPAPARPRSMPSGASQGFNPSSGDTTSSKNKRKRNRNKKKPRKQNVGRKEGKKRRRTATRREERAKAAAQRNWAAPPSTHGASFARRPPPATISVDADAAVDYHVTKGAYTARREKSLSQVPWERVELDARGFEYFDWCGTVAYAILDNEDRVIAVLVPPPLEGDDRSDKDRWAAAMERAASLFEKKREDADGSFGAKQKTHRRGQFTALATGVSYGGGQKKPGNLKNSKCHEELLRALTDDADVSRIANFQSDVMASYFPKVYTHVYDSLRTLSESQPNLRRNFPGGSIYPTVTFNLGPSTVCNDHNDCNNAPDAPCAITALGDFDPDKGGELYLWDLALIIRFPPGTTILLSSASMRHGNLPIQEGEHRYSMTQYCPGGLLRWVRHGLRPASSLSKPERAALDGDHNARWATVLGRLSKYDELEQDREQLMRWERSRQ